ncbi:MAG TPA: YetF domain-containing protein [Chthoniobacterales bacterium]|nr:YetF domain-containing protein [Chthoniobacterales bacterium]
MNTLQNFFLILLGPDAKATELSVLNVSVRGFLIFLVGLALVRIGDRRSLSEKTAFDAIFIVLLGSVLSRAINGTGPFFITIAAAIALMVTHRLFAFGACKSHAFGKLIKGQPRILVRNGEIDWEEMKSALVSKHDFEEDLRIHAKTEDLGKIKIARLERSGDISFIKTEP